MAMEVLRNDGTLMYAFATPDLVEQMTESDSAREAELVDEPNRTVGAKQARSGGDGGGSDDDDEGMTWFTGGAPRYCWHRHAPLATAAG